MASILLPSTIRERESPNCQFPFRLRTLPLKPPKLGTHKKRHHTHMGFFQIVVVVPNIIVSFSLGFPSNTNQSGCSNLHFEQHQRYGSPRLFPSQKERKKKPTFIVSPCFSDFFFVFCRFKRFNPPHATAEPPAPPCLRYPRKS